MNIHFNSNTPFIPSPLYAIVNVASQEGSLAFIEDLLDSGVRLIQLRAKTLSHQAFVELALAAVKIVRQECYRMPDSPLLIINDSVDICALAKADGVHLGQGDGSCEDARQILGPRAVIGQSNHNLAQLSAAPTDVLDYLALGPIFASPTKSGHAPEVGLEILAEGASIAPLPLVAIGGITAANAGQVYRAGAASVAVISSLQNTTNLRQIVSEYNSAHEQAVRQTSVNRHRW